MGCGVPGDSGRHVKLISVLMRISQEQDYVTVQHR